MVIFDYKYQVAHFTIFMSHQEVSLVPCCPQWWY